MLNNFAFTPPNGLRDSTYNPTDPPNETFLRDIIQDMGDQLRDYINGLKASDIPNDAISGMTSLYIQDALAELKGIDDANKAYLLSVISTAVLSGLSPDSITDAYLKQTGNNLLPNFNAHLIDYTLQVPYGGATTGSANTYVLASPTIAALTAGMAVSLKINIDSNAASTLNWNGKGAKGIKKANGTDVTNLKANGIYTLRYDGTNFILQGEGASGNAIASDLLLGKTATTDAGDITGTMPNKVGSSTVFTAGASDVPITQGYYGGSAGDGKVAAITLSAGDNILLSPTNFGLGTTYEWDTATAQFPNYYNDTTSYVKAAHYTINFGGTIRVKFNLFANGAATAYGRIYKNGIAVGTERTTTAQPGSSVTFTEDFTVAVNDTIEIWLKSSSAVQSRCVRFRICATNTMYATLTGDKVG